MRLPDSLACDVKRPRLVEDEAVGHSRHIANRIGQGRIDALYAVLETLADWTETDDTE